MIVPTIVYPSNKFILLNSLKILFEKDLDINLPIWYKEKLNKKNKIKF